MSHSMSQRPSQRPLSQRSRWWLPDVHSDRRPLLRARQRVLAGVRSDLESRDFVEVETAILQVSPGNEAHLHAFATELTGPGGAGQPFYLHTSPEFACKKLLAAGERRIFEFARVFRNREQGALHHPEFTMLEWYRAGETCEALMADCTRFLGLAAAAAGTDRFVFRGREADPAADPERLSVAEAFARHAGIDLLAALAADGTGDRDLLAAAARARGVTVAADDTFGDIFSRVLVQCVEPEIGNGRATFLTDYPACEAALARPSASDPRVAERFELFVCGVELANGFGELTDPVVQRQRLEAEMDLKHGRYGERYPLDEDFLAALALMPPAAGCALGFDRLVMLAARASRVEQVIWTPLPLDDV